MVCQCCEGGTPSECPTDCDECQEYTVTITNWGDCDCRDGTYTLEFDGPCVYQWDRNDNPGNDCCRDEGMGIRLQCFVIDGVAYWRLAIFASDLLNDGHARCPPSILHGESPSIVGFRLADGCPPTGDYNVAYDFSHGFCDLPDVVVG